MDNIIKLDKEALHLIKSKTKGKDIGIHVLPRSSGGIFYKGLCDIGSIINAFYYASHEQIRADICPSEFGLLI
jgi:hypothetical protein